MVPMLSGRYQRGGAVVGVIRRQDVIKIARTERVERDRVDPTGVGRALDQRIGVKQRPASVGEVDRIPKGQRCQVGGRAATATPTSAWVRRTKGAHRARHNRVMSAAAVPASTLAMR